MAPAPAGWDTVYESFAIIECIPQWVEWQGSQRAASPNAEVRAGINYSIILGASCFVEGSFERMIFKRIQDPQESSTNLARRLVDDLRSRASNATASKYDELFGLAFGAGTAALINDAALAKALLVMFTFRNVMAHGRAVSYALHFPPRVGGIWTDDLAGGYRVVEQFLIARGLLTERHLEVANNYHYLTDQIADFFWRTALAVVVKLDQETSGQANLSQSPGPVVAS